MEEILLALSKLQRTLHIYLCAELNQNNKAIDHNLVSMLFRYIISQEEYPASQEDTIQTYLKILLGNDKGKRALGHALRIKKMTIAKSGDFDLFAKLSSHAKKLGIDTFDDADVIDPQSFIDLVDGLAEHNHRNESICMEDGISADLIYSLYHDEEKGEPLQFPKSDNSGCLAQMITLMIICVVLVIGL